MSPELDAYKEFIDGIVDYHGSVDYIVKAFIERRWDNDWSRVLSDLSDEERTAAAAVMRKAAETAIHDFLVYITDRRYSISRDGIELAERPFDNALYEDYIARLDRIPWPDEFGSEGERTS